MWYENAIFYQIYPIGFCGAPDTNDGVTVSRILKVIDWIPHLKALGINALYFSPVFQSDAHGYDTRDYLTIDCRLGTNEDFKNVCSVLKANGIRVVLDGVFNHVGRGFWAFKDVMENRQNSHYKDWFNIDFNGNSGYNDGFWYEGWEGHFELVKLNLRHPDVKNHLFSAIKSWIEEFDIDGLRLDVAYCLDMDFLRELRTFCKGLKNDFFILGEMLHGDYNRLVNDQMLDSCTNYECYKGLYSSFNSLNMFEISYSLNRQFGKENWCLYRGKHLLSFGDNHDVTRLYSILTEKKHLPLLYAMIFTMPGIPCIYYGSEWGAEGKKENSDKALRPSFEKPLKNELTEFISKLSKIKTDNTALNYGGYENITVTNKQLIFKRSFENQAVITAINAEENQYQCYNSEVQGKTELLTGEICSGSDIILPPYSVKIFKV